MTDNTAPRRMPKGGRLSREAMHARKVAEAYRKFEEALPDMLDKLTKRILAPETPPGVFVQSLGTLDKILAYLPKPAVPNAAHLDALTVLAALNRIAENPAKYVVRPVDQDAIRAEHARLDEERAALEVKIAEVKRLRDQYHELQESRPLPDRPRAPEDAVPPEGTGQGPIAPEVAPDLAPWVASLQADPPEEPV